MQLRTVLCLALAALAALLAAPAAAFVAPAGSPALAARARLPTAQAVQQLPRAAAVRLEAKKATEEEDSKYWQGDWVCADCGYIYNRFVRKGRGGRCARRLGVDDAAAPRC